MRKLSELTIDFWSKKGRLIIIATVVIVRRKEGRLGIRKRKREGKREGEPHWHRYSKD